MLILDNSQTSDQLDDRLVEKIAGKFVLTCLNKSDLPAKFDTVKFIRRGGLPEILSNIVPISAKEGIGIENLLEKIRRICGVADFDLKTPVVFTSRQEEVLKQLKNAKSKQQATSIITELLNGQV